MAPSIVPHPKFVVSEIRRSDIWLLLAAGAGWELLCRLVLLSKKRKSSDLLRKEDAFRRLQKETDRKRKMGPSAFVETSKLERQLLASEKELSEVYAARKKSAESIERGLLKYGRIVMAVLTFVLYYGVAIVTVDTFEGDVDSSSGGVGGAGGNALMKALLFPLSYIGFAIRASRFGMDKDVAASSVGALVVLWSGQATAGTVMDAVDALVLS